MSTQELINLQEQKKQLMLNLEQIKLKEHEQDQSLQNQKPNQYWPAYKNLEEEVLKLSDCIYFSDEQINTFSKFIADLLVRCSVEIEAISKELYYILFKDEKVNNEIQSTLNKIQAINNKIKAEENKDKSDISELQLSANQVQIAADETQKIADETQKMADETQKMADKKQAEEIVEQSEQCQDYAQKTSMENQVKSNEWQKAAAEVQQLANKTQKLANEAQKFVQTVLSQNKQTEEEEQEVKKQVLACVQNSQKIATDAHNVPLEKEEFLADPKNVKNMKTGKIKFDSQCLHLLEQKWCLSKKQVVIYTSNFYFNDIQNRILTPLLNADKLGKHGCEWKQAYQAVKHDRMSCLRQATVKNLLNALGALYILNLYYRDKAIDISRIYNNIDGYRINGINRYSNSEIFATYCYAAFEISSKDERYNLTLALSETDILSKSIYVRKYNNVDLVTLHEKYRLNTSFYSKKPNKDWDTLFITGEKSMIVESSLLDFVSEYTSMKDEIVPNKYEDIYEIYPNLPIVDDFSSVEFKYCIVLI